MVISSHQGLKYILLQLQTVNETNQVAMDKSSAQRSANASPSSTSHEKKKTCQAALQNSSAFLAPERSVHIQLLFFFL